MAMGILQEQGGRPAAQCQRTWVALAAALVCASVGAQEAATTATATATTLSEVVVSASGFEQDIKEAPASITVISREQLQEKRVSNLAQALEDVEGVVIHIRVDRLR